MPRNTDPLRTRRAAQLKALAQVRNTLPLGDSYVVMDLFDLAGGGCFDVSRLSDKQLELLDALARTYLVEVMP